MPTTPLGRIIYFVLRPLELFHHLAADSEPDGSGTLLAFYDLAVAPVTFDFLWFLVGAEVERRRANFNSIHIIIVPGTENGLRKEHPDYDAVVDHAARQARIVNIIIPACRFLNTISGTIIATSRAHADRMQMRAPTRVFPKKYKPALPGYPGPLPYLEAARKECEDIAVLRATTYDLRSAEAWLSERALGRLPVIITLRDYQFMPARNSDLKAWTKFAQTLDTTKFLPIFIPDTDQCLGTPPSELTPFTVCPEASWNLGLRMALYEKAYVNLGVNNGPMGLCWLNSNTRYITFKILSESVPQTTADYMKHLGFEIGCSLPFATPWQKWVWEDDTADVIAREFTAFVRRMDSGNISV